VHASFQKVASRKIAPECEFIFFGFEDWDLLSSGNRKGYSISRL